MRELLSARNINLISGVIGAIASVFLSIAVVVLVTQNADQAHELSCRSELAAQTDVLRSEITIALSQGLVATVEEDTDEVIVQINRIHDLQERLAEASERRADTVEICQR